MAGQARFAPEPFGPWSPPIIMLSAVEDPNLVCTLIQGVNLARVWRLVGLRPERSMRPLLWRVSPRTSRHRAQTSRSEL
jgi:hypothetical protein